MNEQELSAPISALISISDFGVHFNAEFDTDFNTDFDTDFDVDFDVGLDFDFDVRFRLSMFGVDSPSFSF